MSQVKISGNASGTGVLTIAAPNTNTDRTINIPDTAGDIVTTGDSGTITAGMLDGGQSGSTPAFAVRAWCSFDGTGTISIYQSGNVSSLTDNGTGDYSINFTTDMPTAAQPQYVAMHTSNAGSAGAASQQQFTLATGSYRMLIKAGSSSTVDTNYIAVICIG